MNATFVHRVKLKQNELDVNVTDSFPELWVTKAGLQFEVNTFQVRQLRILCIADLFNTFSTRAEVVLNEEKPRLAQILYTSRDSASCKYIRPLSRVFDSVVIIGRISKFSWQYFKNISIFQKISIFNWYYNNWSELALVPCSAMDLDRIMPRTQTI